MDIPTSTKGEPHRLFPDVFHSDITTAIDEFERQGFNREYAGTAMLSILSTAIGTSYSIHGLEHNHTEPAILWAVLAGNSGTAKTALIKQMLRPVQEVNRKQIRQSKQLIDEWEAQPKKSRGPKPPIKKSILKDFTFEALSQATECNPKGILLHSDEVLGFIANLNKYNNGKGGDLENLLGMWSGEGISVSRVTRDHIETETSNVNILGGIQTKRLKKLITPESIDSGQANRFIFAYPDARAKYPHMGETDPQALDKYRQVVIDLMSAGHWISTLHLTQEARERLYRWTCQNRDQINQYNDEGNDIAGALSKYESHLLRFALILQVSDDYCQDIKPSGISLQAVEGAISLFDFYIGNILRIYAQLQLADNLQHLKTWQIQLIRYLPETLDRKDAIEARDTLRLQATDRSVDSFLGDAKVFEHLAQGKYRKRASA